MYVSFFTHGSDISHANEQAPYTLYSVYASFLEQGSDLRHEKEQKRYTTHRTKTANSRQRHSTCNSLLLNTVHPFSQARIVSYRVDSIGQPSFTHMGWIVIYSNLEFPLTKPNEPKCIRYGRIGLRLFASVNQERIRGMPHRCEEECGARTAIEGAET